MHVLRTLLVLLIIYVLAVIYRSTGTYAGVGVGGWGGDSPPFGSEKRFLRGGGWGKPPSPHPTFLFACQRGWWCAMGTENFWGRKKSAPIKMPPSTWLNVKISYLISCVSNKFGDCVFHYGRLRTKIKKSTNFNTIHETLIFPVCLKILYLEQIHIIYWIPNESLIRKC